jgi:hypothetical protein
VQVRLSKGGVEGASAVLAGLEGQANMQTKQQQQCNSSTIESAQHQPASCTHHAWRLEGHLDGVGVPLPRQHALRVELDRVRHRPALGKRGLVREGRVCEVQQVLDEQAVLHRHLQLDLCVHHVAGWRLRGGRHLLKTPKQQQAQSIKKQSLRALRNQVAAAWWLAPVDGGSG